VHRIGDHGLRPPNDPHPELNYDQHKVHQQPDDGDTADLFRWMKMTHKPKR
jgi:hypothetical protein